MDLDDLIRDSLKQAAEETEMSKEDKTYLLLDVLTKFLTNQVSDTKEKPS